MTEHRPITAAGLPRQTTEAKRILTAHMTAVAQIEHATPAERADYEISASLIAAYYIAARQNRHVAITTVDHILEISGAELPDLAPFFGGLASDADDFAEWASDAQVVAMLAACIKRLHRNPLVRPNPKKRALVAIWNSLAADDKRAFLDRVAQEAAP